MPKTHVSSSKYIRQEALRASGRKELEEEMPELTDPSSPLRTEGTSFLNEVKSFQSSRRY